MKKIMILTLCVIMAISLVACGNKTAEDDTSTPPTMGNGGTTQVVNPFVKCDDITQAEKLAGFTFTLPTGFEPTVIRAAENDMIEAIAGNDENEIRIRKANGNEDISGNYNEYAEVQEIEIDTKNVTIKGNDGVINVATWTDGEYTYSIGTTSGLSVDEITTLVAETK